MNVFVPSTILKKNAKILDNARLHKQLYEGLHILRVHAGERTGWRTHPATQAWQFHTPALHRYLQSVASELISRGYNLIYAPRELDRLYEQPPQDLPEWWGDMRIHDSHKARLMQKKPSYYLQFGWQDYIPNWESLDYEWPIWDKDGLRYVLEHRGAFIRGFKE